MDFTENEPGGRLSLVPARQRGVALVAQAHQEHAGVGMSSRYKYARSGVPVPTSSRWPIR